MMRSDRLQEFIQSRQSIRQFTPDAIEPGTVQRILRTATFAPSAHNRQPWRFAVISSPRMRTALADAMALEFARDLNADGKPASERNVAVERSRRRITSAPVAILLCMAMVDMDSYPDERRASAERTMAIQSVANAGCTLLLAAHAEGLAGVWICGPLFAPEAVARALQLPPEWEPQALLLIGQPAAIPPPRARRDINDVVAFK